MTGHHRLSDPSTSPCVVARSKTQIQQGLFEQVDGDSAGTSHGQHAF
jgi:hypothetical protein